MNYNSFKQYILSHLKEKYPEEEYEINVRKIMKDGQIIIIRGEQQYNVQGQRIE
mgnify:CR=1 FL=1